MLSSTDIEMQKDPEVFLSWLREKSPVYQDPETGVYFVTLDEDIRQVAMDTKSFSNVIDPSVFRVVQGYALEKSDPEVAEILKSRGWLLPSTLLLIDPPDHTPFRRLAQEVLGPRPVKQLSEHIKKRADELIDRFPNDGELDFVDAYAKQLPIWVIGKFIFGAPESDFEKINDWADQFFLTVMPSAPREEYLHTVDMIIEMHHYIKRRIEQFRVEPNDEILLSRLTSAHEATGDSALSDEEMMSMMHVLLLAGHDTTRQTLASCLMELAKQPHIAQRLRGDSKLIPAFITEVMRLHPAANVTSRICVRDTTIRGVVIPANSMVFLAWGSANRDSGAHDNPEVFDLDRKDKKNHLSFGWGLHHCVGAHLARAQLHITIEQLLQKFSKIELMVDVSELDYLPSMNTRSLMSLPLKFIK